MRCEYCGKGFQPRHPRGRFCGTQCRVAAWHERRAKAARAPLERILTAFLARVEEALEEAKAGLRGREGQR